MISNATGLKRLMAKNSWILMSLRGMAVVPSHAYVLSWEDGLASPLLRDEELRVIKSLFVKIDI
jgi:hypothetical protein